MKTENFIKRSKLIHGDKYSYELVNYVNNTTKVKIICPIHGIFEQRPCNHLDGKGCKLCGREKTLSSIRRDLDYFLNKSKNIYGDSYDYSKVDFKNMSTEVEMVFLNKDLSFILEVINV